MRLENVPWLHGGGGEGDSCKKGAGVLPDLVPISPSEAYQLRELVEEIPSRGGRSCGGGLPDGGSVGEVGDH